MLLSAGSTPGQHPAPTGCREKPWGARGPMWVLGTGTWCWAAKGLLHWVWRGAARRSDPTEPIESTCLATSLPRNTPNCRFLVLPKRSPLKFPTEQCRRGRGCGRAAPRGRGGQRPVPQRAGRALGADRHRLCSSLRQGECCWFAFRQMNGFHCLTNTHENASQCKFGRRADTCQLWFITREKEPALRRRMTCARRSACLFSEECVATADQANTWDRYITEDFVSSPESFRKASHSLETARALPGARAETQPRGLCE